MKLKLIKTLDRHYWSDCMIELEQAFRLECLTLTFEYPGNIRLKRQLIRIFRHVYPYFPRQAFRIFQKLKNQEYFYFSAQMGVDFAYVFPNYLKSEKNYAYIFDAWPRGHKVLSDWVDIFNIKKIFLSSLQTVEHFNAFRGELNKKAVWIPEGIMPMSYLYYPYDKKNIDVLEFGRRYESYHEKIKTSLLKSGKKHVYQKSSDLLFKTKNEFCDALGLAKISICIPSDITHPERAEFISTMTQRYLQSMLSKCLIVGRLPYDMQYLFDYNPLIEYDEKYPGDQIIEILEKFEQYIPLIEENYRNVMEKHLWTNRVRSMLQYMV